MRWIYRALLPLLALVGIYVGTAVVSLRGLVEDTRNGNAAAVLSRIDLPRFRSSLAEQIVRAHFGRIELTRPVKTIERVAAPAIVDALLARLLTPENIMRVLRDGTLPADSGTTPLPALPSLRSAGFESSGRILARLRPVSLVQFRLLLDDTGQTAVHMHFELTHWKLSGLDLPPPAIARLIAGVAVR